MNSLPSKDDLKEKYNITNDDFDVLTRFPTQDEKKQRGGFLLKLGEALGVEEWMWKSFSGFVIALIIILPTATGIWDYWKPKAIYSYDQIAGYFQTVNPEQERDDSGFIAFSRHDDLPKDPSHVPDIFPTGTMVVSNSGSFQG